MDDRSVWDDVERHLDRLLDLDASERTEALAELARAGAPPAVVERLRGCLDTSFLRRPASEAVPALWEASAGEDSAAEESWIGRRLGAWRIVGKLGEGGMGRVFEVERDDGQYSMRAALKLLARSGGAEMLDRFRLERQILARLDHPHIARLLDGGTTDDGRPWLVLERVEGEPIDAWCERRGAGIAERLRLFLQVCSAVAHAHRQLVVHRDLKPANVLVNDEGQARLLDFGIAQLVLAAPAAEESAGRALTPGYAAPEQIRGEAVSTSTDVWALGALLYKLLAGVGPFAAGEPDGAELLRRTLAGDPPPPSVAAGERPLARRLRGDLDAIVLRALAGRPEARYGSAQQLVEDVERHLAEWPVVARPASMPLRVRKFVRRHRLGAAVASVAAAIVLGGLATVLVRLDHAEQERERAERIAAFLADLLAVGDPSQGEGYQVAADVLMRRALERAESEFAGRPELQAAVFHQVGDVLLRLRLEADARVALERAAALRRQLAPEGSDELVESLVRLGYSYQYAELAHEGLPPLEEAVAIARRRHGPRDPRLADTLVELATFASRYVRADHPRFEALRERARSAYGEALEIHRARFGERHPSTGEVLRNLAFTTDDPSHAIALLERAVAAHETAGGATQGLGYALADLAILFDRVDRRVEAEATMRRALETLQAVEGDDALIELTVMNNLAGILRDHGRFAEAEPLYREVLARRERLNPHDRNGRAYALYGLGRVALGLGNSREAELHLGEAAELLAAAELSTLAAIARGWLSEALAAQGRRDEALSLAARSADELVAALGSGADEAELAVQRLEKLRAGGSPDAGRPAASHTPVEG
jgi:serine/threonine protein kinase